MRSLVPASFRAVVALAAAAMLAACGGTPSKEEQEAAKNTFTCLQDGERLVIRFDAGEAGCSLPRASGVLYQIPTASGVRFTNGTLELRGKGASSKSFATPT